MLRGKKETNSRALRTELLRGTEEVHGHSVRAVRSMRDTSGEAADHTGDGAVLG